MEVKEVRREVIKTPLKELDRCISGYILYTSPSNNEPHIKVIENNSQK
jgi:hypothetical protein